MFESLVAIGISLLPFLLTLTFSAAVLILTNRLLFKDPSLSTSAKFPRQILMLTLHAFAIISLVISLPVDKDTRNQILALFGILLSGVIAFSSTSLVANIMAGAVFRITKPFRTGDFIRVSGHFGRVVEKGFVDTEIQTEQRDLIAFSNSYLLNHPIQVVRNSGTIISATLSLGFDVQYKRVEKLLLGAAEAAGLTEPFVQITELGNFSIVYRISGLLTDVKSMLSSRSKLHGCILDALHADNIEIVSPNFMNTRNITEQPAFIAKPDTQLVDDDKQSTPEDVVFDKAEAAEKLEQQELVVREQIAKLEASVKEADSDEKEQLTTKIEQKKTQLERLLKLKEQEHK